MHKPHKKFGPLRSRFQKKHEWTREETLKLRDLAGSMPVEAVASEMGRTVVSIKNKCQKHGFKYSFNKLNDLVD